MSDTPDTVVLMPDPVGGGLLAITLAQLMAASVRAAEILLAISAPTCYGAADGAAPAHPAVLLDAAGMAAATGVPASWFEAAARRGEIPNIKFGRWVRFAYDAVVAHAREVGTPRLAHIEVASTTPPATLPVARRLRVRASRGKANGNGRGHGEPS